MGTTSGIPPSSGVADHGAGGVNCRIWPFGWLGWRWCNLSAACWMVKPWTPNFFFCGRKGDGNPSSWTHEGDEVGKVVGLFCSFVQSELKRWEDAPVLALRQSILWRNTRISGWCPFWLESDHEFKLCKNDPCLTHLGLCWTRMWPYLTSLPPNYCGWVGEFPPKWANIVSWRFQIDCTHV